VTAQVALSFLLLFGAGLFVRSLQNLKGADTGVALDNLVTFQLSPALSGYDDTRAQQLYGIQARDPVIGGSTVLLLAIVSAAAGLIPAQRASRTDPILALRQE
jgi:ABC-type lipoprotein release transport system permease subunit